MSQQANSQDIQTADREHHIHPFSNTGALNKQGARVIEKPKGYISGTVKVTKSSTVWPVCGASIWAMAARNW